MSGSASFSTSALSTGQHTIFFKVQDDMGRWSQEVSAHLDVANQALNTEGAGNRHSLALLSDGTVWVWGINGFCQIGDGTINRLTPVPVAGF